MDPISPKTLKNRQQTKHTRNGVCKNNTVFYPHTGENSDHDALLSLMAIKKNQLKNTWVQICMLVKTHMINTMKTFLVLVKSCHLKRDF